MASVGHNGLRRLAVKYLHHKWTSSVLIKFVLNTQYHNMSGCTKKVVRTHSYSFKPVICKSLTGAAGPILSVWLNTPNFDESVPPVSSTETDHSPNDNNSLISVILKMQKPSLLEEFITNSTGLVLAISIIPVQI